MGLIAGVLLPLWLGFPGVSHRRLRLSFLKRLSSAGWKRFRVTGGTTVAAPNFAYQACVEAASADDAREFDLTTWQVAWNGAEPVRQDTLDRFREQFAENGFQPESIAPAYGLAEATLVVSGSDGSKPAMELTVAGTRCGQGRYVDIGEHFG